MQAYRKRLLDDTMQYPMNLIKIQASQVVRYGNYVFFLMLGEVSMEDMERGDQAALEAAQAENQKAVDAVEEDAVRVDGYGIQQLCILFRFLPAVLLVYYLVPRIYKNLVLFLASLIFYAWGEPPLCGTYDFFHSDRLCSWKTGGFLSQPEPAAGGEMHSRLFSCDQCPVVRHF